MSDPITGPRRIVCLTEETVETLYLLGQEHRIVGVTGYAVRPPRVRRKSRAWGPSPPPIVPKILALEPDLVLTFSDLQADIAADLIRAGIAVHAFNQRDVTGILEMIRNPWRTHRRSGSRRRADRRSHGADRRGPGGGSGSDAAPRRLSRGMGRSADLGHRLGLGTGGNRGRPRYLRRSCPSPGREIPDYRSRRCDRRRPGGDHCIMVRQEGAARTHRRPSRVGQYPRCPSGRIHEIKSPLILQPGPAALTDGLDGIRTALWGRA